MMLRAKASHLLLFLLAATPSYADVTIGTVATTPGFVFGVTSKTIDVEITANTKALVVFVPNSSAADDITVTLDPGGADEVSLGPSDLDFEVESDADNSSAHVKIGFITDIPGPGTYDFNLADTSGSRGGCVVYPLESANALEVVQTAVNKGPGSSISVTFAGASANGSFVAMGTSTIQNPGSGVTHTWADLDEVFDAAESTESASVAGRVDPTEKSSYTATFSGATTGATAALIEIAEVVAEAAFTASPTLDDCTDEACTFDFTTDIDATVHGVLCPTNLAPPTGAQIVAETCSDDGAANASGSEVTAGAVADSLTLTPSDEPEFPEYDAHFIACPESGVCP